MLREMSKSNLANILFPQTRKDILAATYSQPERWWYISELAEYLDTVPSSLQRELKSLSQGGILKRKKDGNRVYFCAENESPIFEPLKELIKLTAGLIPNTREAFTPWVKAINCAFIFGSVASETEDSQSDVDLMIIGSVGLSELAANLKNLERKFDREFNAKCYKAKEFKEKIKQGNHFLTKVLEEEKIFIVGGESDLKRLIK